MGALAAQLTLLTHSLGLSHPTSTTQPREAAAARARPFELHISAWQCLQVRLRCAHTRAGLVMAAMRRGWFIRPCRTLW